MDIIEIIKLLLGCLFGAAVCFAVGYFYHRAKHQYLEAEREYLHSLDKKEDHHDN